MSKTWGYARCSTNEDKQDINRQIRELKAAGADEVVFEYEHGDAKVKKNLHMLLDMVTEGDTIITLEVSRLSRSTQQLCEIIDTILEHPEWCRAAGSQSEQIATVYDKSHFAEQIEDVYEAVRG